MTKSGMVALISGLAVSLSACGGSTAAPSTASSVSVAASSPPASASAAASASASRSAAASPASGSPAASTPAAPSSSGAASASASANAPASGSAATSSSGSAQASAPGSAAPSVAPAQKVTLQLAQPLAPLAQPYTVKARIGSSLTTAPFWFAYDRGYFDQLGLKFETVQIEQGVDVVAPLVRAQVDVAAVPFNPGLYNAVTRGVDVVAVADDGQLTPGLAGSAAVVKKGEAAKYGKDWCALKGKTVAGQIDRDAFYPTLMKALSSCNLQMSDVKTVNPGFAAVNQALANGAADVAFQVEPFIAQGIAQNLIEVWKPLDEAWANQQMNVILYSPDFVKNNEAGLRFMVAYMAGVRAYNDALKPGGNKDELFNTFARHLPEKNPSSYSHMIMMGIQNDGAINMSTTREELQIFQQGGIIGPGNLDLNWINNDLRQKALAYLGPAKS